MKSARRFTWKDKQTKWVNDMSTTSARMIYRGIWDFCSEYRLGEVVYYNGVMYLALQQSAGKYPDDPANTAYWRLIGGGGAAGESIHNLLSGLQGGTELERFHLTRVAALAAEEGGGSNGGGLPPGGDTGQVLTKMSPADGDADWSDIVIDLIRPFRPHTLSPEDGSIDVPTLTRLKLSPYRHPINTPADGSKWQIATDADFNNLILDRTLLSTATDSIVVSENAASVPYLEPSTAYFWRGAYIDIMGNVSAWSGAAEFMTYSGVATEVILQPDMITPVNNGWIPERRLLAHLTTPEVLGLVVPDVMDVQVSMSPGFAPVDIIANIEDYNHTTILMDDSADFSNAPSPLFLRARQKDSVRNIISPWSVPPTVWLQRAFRDMVVGRMHIVDGTRSMSQWIDKGGNPVNIMPAYWNDHPIWGGVVQRDDVMMAGVERTAFRIPGFFCKCDTEEIGIDRRIHRYWVSPTPIDESWYLHPAFALSHNGVFVTGLIPRGWVIGSDATTDVQSHANWLNDFGNTPDSRLRPYNVHVRCALLLLASIERSSQVVAGTLTLPWRGLTILLPGQVSRETLCLGVEGEWFNNNLAVMPELPDSTANMYIGAPSNPAERFLLGDVIGPRTPATRVVKRIFTGFNNNLGAHLDMYNIPREVSTDAAFVPVYQTIIAHHNTTAATPVTRHVNGLDMTAQTTVNGNVANFMSFGISPNHRSDAQANSRIVVID